VEYRTAPPLLGEQSAQILERVVGLSETEIEELMASGVIS
jgi:crotonobetainyl-CoA:carnitine CoA-transferase CaiB-like acyl-CoA transferase